jgi:hypothetical protein
MSSHAISKVKVDGVDYTGTIADVIEFSPTQDDKTKKIDCVVAIEYKDTKVEFQIETTYASGCVHTSQFFSVGETVAGPPCPSTCTTTLGLTSDTSILIN